MRRDVTRSQTSTRESLDQKFSRNGLHQYRYDRPMLQSCKLRFDINVDDNYI